MIDFNKKLLMIICDGKIKNSDSVATTDRLLTDYIFLNNIEDVYKINKAYKTWDNTWEDLEIFCGVKNGLRLCGVGGIFMELEGVMKKSRIYKYEDNYSRMRKLQKIF